jgi:charged multivesicular body protein 2A
MGSAFGKQKSIKEITRENQRMINKAIRELDREIKNIEREQKKFEIEIKKAGKKNEIKAARLIAKDIVRSRANISRFMEMRSTLNGVSMKLLTIKSHDAMANAMKGVTKAMTKMNKMNDVPALQKLMADFMRENEKSDMTQEMIADTMDDAFDEEGALEEEELIVNQVLDELGIDFGGLQDAPQTLAGGVSNEKAEDTRVAAPLGVGDNSSGGGGMGGDQSGGPGGDSSMSDLEARLQNLRRND